ncbi:hypothetical protein PA10_00118 [Pseudomonas phage pPa_SNUABM_DT01]|nr:hypothetical protein PA10_00118 [Pseudomonas phage pPa_SNUABM_DT01]
MNLFVSLEEVLSPIGEPKAPTVGLLVQDWDENVTGVAEQVVNLGYGVQLIPAGAKYSPEGIGHTTMTKSAKEKTPQSISERREDHGDEGDNDVPDPRNFPHQPQVLFYYKGKPEDAAEGIPVLVAEDGKVKVSVEGRVKELAEYLGMLEENDNDPGDHEYR